MLTDATFSGFLSRVRAGDAEAAAELFRLYEPAIRLEVRLNLVDRRLRRVFDSMDICQSVLATFFLRASAGQFDLSRPDQLLKLLVAITRNKTHQQARALMAGRRDYRRDVGIGKDGLDLTGDPSPSRLVAGRELLEQCRRRMTPEERELAELRLTGHDWASIADRLGGTAKARCKQFARALDRVARELGLEEGEPDA